MDINLVFIVTILILIMSIIVGGLRGFFKSSLSLVALILSGIIVMALNPLVTGFLRNNTKLDEWIEGKVAGMITEEQNLGINTDGDSVTLEKDIALPMDIQLPNGTVLPAGTILPAGTTLPKGIGFDELLEQVNENLSTAQQSKIIESLPIPESLRNTLEENNNSAIYKELGVSQFTDYIGSFISNICLNIIGYIVTFLIVFFALQILMLVFNVVDRLPIIHGINHFAGALLGIVKGLLLLEILFLLLIPFTATAFGQNVLGQIESNAFLSMLYHKNILIRLLMMVVGKTF
ncbi:CvpA family protein [Qiania dongpingensis]|uniref:CvpA family protein n=1 Tax=Qiania dongpingensis TaxID=2763669 RepID=A0A7G9G1B9_9FIRM|nr:CvpA family protein [Qiania dongpingensis]QNM04601.1 CvpA family protein [Qiania dongpingensis]